MDEHLKYVQDQMAAGKSEDKIKSSLRIAEGHKIASKPTDIILREE